MGAVPGATVQPTMSRFYIGGGGLPHPVPRHPVLSSTPSTLGFRQVISLEGGTLVVVVGGSM